MSVDKQNATIYAGDDAVLSIAIVDENGKPLSVSGASFAWILAASAGATATLSKTLSSGIVVTHALSGYVSVNISHTDTTGLLGPMWHQLVMTDGSGDVSTVTTGTLTFVGRT